MNNADPLLDVDQAASYLHTPAKTLGVWRWKSIGPKFVRMGRRVLYRQSDLDAFIAASVVKTEDARRRKS